MTKKKMRRFLCWTQLNTTSTYVFAADVATAKRIHARNTGVSEKQVRCKLD